jgi:hypothetical protein
MSAPKGHHGNRPHPAVADAQSLVLPRDQAGIAAQTAQTAQTVHTVHLAPLPRLSGMPPRVVLPVPDPQFPIQTPAGRRSSTPVPPCAPGGQSVPRHPQEEPSVGQPPWPATPARSGVHPLEPAGVTMATTRGHTRARREHLGPAEGSDQDDVPRQDYSDQRRSQIPVHGAVPPSIAGWSVG